MQVRFGDSVLDRGTRQLLRNGQEHRIGPKAFDLLELLLSHPPNVVAKERIRDRLWPDSFVSGSTLATVVAELRSVLGEFRSNRNSSARCTVWAMRSAARQGTPDRRGARVRKSPRPTG